MSDDETATHTQAVPLGPPAWLEEREVLSGTFEVLEGPTTPRFTCSDVRCAIGSHSSNDLVIDHPTVSRFHCEVELRADGAVVSDRESHNGTSVDGVRVKEAWLHDGSVLSLGAVRLRFAWGEARTRVRSSAQTRIGSLVGRSTAMRETFAVIERVAPSDATVLISGETGTGKEGAAEAIHLGSRRAEGPFTVIDCAALPPTLVESELFGHERGAFSGARQAHVGAFERADGGTVFLDEVGELPREIQPKLLRVLEERSLRRVGGRERVAIDVRFLAATRRSLEAEVNRGAFRADLFFRLAVLRVHMPPLRDRLDDLPLLVESLLEQIGATEAARERLSSPAFLSRLRASRWPGNVRELRNALERALVTEDLDPAPGAEDLAGLSWAEARQRALAAFEERFLRDLLERHDNNVSKAARAADVDRVHLHRLLRRYGLR